VSEAAPVLDGTRNLRVKMGSDAVVLRGPM
jgi:hypothetical protein